MSFKIIFFSLLLFIGCVVKPEPVIFGSEFCDYCAMGIHDHRFGGAILTEKGKTYKFDALECLLKFEARKLDKQEIVKERYVFNTFKKGDFVSLEKATFLNIPNTRSPMGLGIWASDTPEQILKAKEQHSGEVLNWSQLKILLQQ